MIVVYITCKDEKEAKLISEKLLKEKLIACSNFFPIKSMYWWKGKIENDNEFAIIIKTQREKFKKIVATIKKIHSYDVPCIESWDVSDTDKDYLKWLKETI